MISSQGINGLDFAEGLGPAPFFYGPACGLLASTGGGFQVTSYSPIAPTGLSIVSENIIEVPVFVGGLLPFLSSVALGSSFSSSGLGSISYGCGDEAVGVVSEGPAATGIVGPYGPAFGLGMYGPGPYGLGLGYGPGISYGPSPGILYGPGRGLYGPGPVFYGPGLFMPAYGPAGYGVVC